MLPVLNILFFVFHTGLIAFNLFGWMLPATRKWNLLTLLLTLASWLVMGFWKGFGYCLCTDYHWQIRRELGIEGDPDTYVALLFQNVGLNPSDEVVFWITAGGFVFAFVMSCALNIRDAVRARTAQT